MGGMVRLCGDDANRQHRTSLHAGNPESSGNRGQDQNRLGHRELGTDADARPGTEWHECKPGGGRLIGHETGGPENIGVLPEPVMD